jgi:hypothetical protein
MSDALDTKSPYDFLVSKRTRGGPREQLTPEEALQKQLDATYETASFLPITGEIISAKEAKEFYDEGRYGMMALAGLGAIPFAGAAIRPLVKGASKIGQATGVNKFINDVAMNMPTNVRGGFIGDILDRMPAVQSRMGIKPKEIPHSSGTTKGAGLPYYTPMLTGVSTVGEGLSALGTTLKSKMNPKDIAFERTTGFPAVKAREIAAGAEGASETAELMASQISKGKSPTLLSPLTSKTYLATNMDVSDTQGLAEAVSTRFVHGKTKHQVPEKTAIRFAKHAQAQVDGKGLVNVKNPRAGGGAGQAEAAGQKSVAPTAVKALQGNARKAYLAELGQESLTPKQTVEFLQIAGALDPITFNKYFKKNGFENVTSAVASLARARNKVARGGTLGKKEKRALESFNKMPVNKNTGQRLAAVKDDAGNLLSNDSLDKIGNVKEGDFLTLQQFFKSSQKELGGANAFISVDPKTQRAYVGISDKHDIGGLNPIQGENMITVQPIVSLDYATGKFGKKAGLADTTTAKGSKQKIRSAVSDVEQMTGVSRKKGENERQFVRRAIMESDIIVSREDKLKALKNLGITLGTGGMLTAGTVAALSDDE